MSFRIEDGVAWVGDKPLPYAKVRSTDYSGPWSHWDRGFWLTFENGWTLSVQWGAGNYCANRSLGDIEPVDRNSCANAEIAAWPATGRGDFIKWCLLDHAHEEENCLHDEVVGYVTPETVLRLIILVSTLPSHNPPTWLHLPKEDDPC